MQKPQWRFDTELYNQLLQPCTVDELDGCIDLWELLGVDAKEMLRMPLSDGRSAWVRPLAGPRSIWAILLVTPGDALPGVISTDPTPVMVRVDGATWPDGWRSIKDAELELKRDRYGRDTSVLLSRAEWRKIRCDPGTWLWGRVTDGALLARCEACDEAGRPTSVMLAYGTPARPAAEFATEWLPLTRNLQGAQRTWEKGRYLYDTPFRLFGAIGLAQAHLEGRIKGPTKKTKGGRGTAKEKAEQTKKFVPFQASPQITQAAIAHYLAAHGDEAFSNVTTEGWSNYLRSFCDKISKKIS